MPRCPSVCSKRCPTSPARRPPPNADTENLIVQGDNLEALKALLPRYAGPKVI